MIRIRTGAAALAAALSLLAGRADAQSVLSARGLGFPLDPVDARARALGGLTTGLAEPHFSLINPAVVAGLPAAGLSVTFQGDGISSESASQAQDFTTSRFPAIQAVFPFGPRFVGSLGYAGVLDQTWSTLTVDSLQLAGERREVTDYFLSKGGTARFRAGAGYRLLDRVDVGIALDLYSGALRDSTRRTISGLQPDSSGTAYNWQGVGFSAGARWRGSALSVSAAVSGGGDLKAEAQDSGVVGKSYGMPLTVDAGASARISQQAMAAVSVRWAQWSAVDEALEGTEEAARDVMQVSGGIEYDGLRLIGRPLPVRLGGRYAQLPFRWDEGTEYANERAVTGGVGVIFGGGAASLEVSGERGQRGDSDVGLVEDFWRMSISLSLLGR